MVGAPGQQRPGGQQQQALARRAVALATVVQAAEPVGAIGADGAGQAEQPDGGIGIAVVRAGQQEGQRRPQHAERGEQQRAEHRAGAQQGLLRVKLDDRGQQARIAQPRRVDRARQHAPQRHRHQQHQDGGHPVDGAPAAEIGQRAGDGARQQDAQQQAAHDGPDHFAAFVRFGQGGGKRHQDLRHDGQQAGHGGAQHEPADAGREGRQQQAHGRQGGHQRDQGAPLVEVAQRHQQDQAHGIAELGHGDDGAGRGGGEGEFGADGMQQRLGVIVAGHGQAGGHGHQQDDGRGQARARRAHCGMPPGVVRSCSASRRLSRPASWRRSVADRGVSRASIASR
ncbi:Uncharacterised protein [Bordetella pertussis]|nr:Uncharacterised protein [Bordetella pertussis]CRE20733.1 Uncharacterised protein [Bordetella pertussis]